MQLSPSKSNLFSIHRRNANIGNDFQRRTDYSFRGRNFAKLIYTHICGFSGRMTFQLFFIEHFLEHTYS